METLSRMFFFQLKNAETRINILLAIGDDALRVIKRAKLKVSSLFITKKVWFIHVLNSKQYSKQV